MAKKTATVSYQDTALSKLRQNYQSILLGLLVVIIGATLISRGITTQDKTGQKKQGVTTEEELVQTTKPGMYKVRAGDDLWKISEKHFRSGYNWTHIATVNNLANPNRILVGQELVIPSVEPGPSTVGETSAIKTAQVTIRGSQYTVKDGDSLWKIALGSYGDGYKWVDIARVNKLDDPNIIHPGNVLKIPR